jgi:hypothetical protein
MFDIRDAFSSVAGRYADVRELERRLLEYQLANLAQLTPELKTLELLSYARQQHWLHEDENGVLIVDLDPQE